MLTKPIICERINEILEAGGFNDENVDKQHSFLLNQFADLKSKLGAIKEYNQLKGRIINKTDITSGGKPIPILGNGLFNNNSNKEGSDTQEED